MSSTVRVADGKVKISVRWLRLGRVNGFLANFDLEPDQIVDASVVSRPASKLWKGLPLGLHLPALVAAGLFFRRDGRYLWDVRGNGDAIRLDVDRERVRGFVLSIDDAAGVVAQIERLRRPA